MNVTLKLAVTLIAVFGLGGCDYVGSFPKNIREFPEPWQVLEPGNPVENAPKVEIVTQGGGATIEPGDLVQISDGFFSYELNGVKNETEWWLWVGFRAQSDTAFYSSNPAQRAALLGLKHGAVVKFLEYRDNPIFAGELYVNPIGDPKYFSWRKHVNDYGKISLPRESGYSLVEIKRVCKGQAQYRTVRLFDDSPVQICSGINCRVSTEEREAWVDEARIDAVCQDGKKVNFQYGPIGSSNGKAGRSPKRGYFDEWFHAAWSKIPEGVQFEGNHAPEVKMSRVTTKAGVPVKIDFLANARDADGDKLTMRIDSSPRHGKLAANPDGGMIYTPEVGWFGLEQLSYRVSDGMAEKGGQVDIEVVQ